MNTSEGTVWQKVREGCVCVWGGGGGCIHKCVWLPESVNMAVCVLISRCPCLHGCVSACVCVCVYVSEEGIIPRTREM